MYLVSQLKFIYSCKEHELVIIIIIIITTTANTQGGAKVALKL